MFNILICCDYCAPYEGSFISSINRLHMEMMSFASITYAFPDSDNKEFQKWFNCFCEGKKIFKYHNNNYNEIYEEILLKNYQVVYLHFFPINFARKIARNCSDIKVILHGHHMPILRRWRCCVELIKSINKRYSNLYVTACSKGVGKKYKLLVRRRNVSTIDNCIDFCRLDRLINESVINKDESSYVISMFGGEYYTKGVDIACNAFKIIDNGRIKLNIYCSHNIDIVKRHIVEQYNGLNIFVLNSNENPCQIYLNSNVFIAPSRYEGFNYSILECAYCGIPVIASNLKEHRHYGNNYLFFKKNNARDLATKMVYAMNKVIQTSDKTIIIDHYDIKNWTNSLVRFFNRITKEY